MNKLFNESFSFLLMKQGSCFDDFTSKKEEVKPVRIPHDWAVGDFDLFYKDNVGFYTKTFNYNVASTKYGKDGHIFLRFDGIYMDSSIYLNGEKIYEWKYGYTSFVVELTQYLIEGNNELTVMVNFQNPNSRWYSGAGIYRNVWLIETADVYIPDGGIYVHYDFLDEDNLSKGAKVTIEADVVGYNNGINAIVPSVSVDGQDKAIDITATEYDVNTNKAKVEFVISDISLWDIDNPDLYKLNVSLVLNKIGGYDLIQNEEINLGFRKIKYTPNGGFNMNGKVFKLNGVCEHHDFGSLGAAFYKEALDRKIDVLKGMGVNAIRTSHNPVPREFYEMCDEKGILVDSEFLDMWEMPKTTYDYARFFPEWYKRDVERWIVDARNHPSVIMWSIGNEIPDTHAGPRGREVAADLMREVLIHDPKQNARVTFGSNYMPWEPTQKVADDLKLVGYNYAESYYDEHHEAHPDWIIYGSETSSIVYSRGVYHFPMAAGILSDDDLQCSSLGNSTTSWGANSIEDCIGVDATKDYSLGQFLWTGFDYLGEPTPYHTKNSYFGQVDTAGFPKDVYYMWQAAWTDVNTNPMVHVFPYWNFNVGQAIDIRVASNAHAVEVFINGKSLGKQVMGDGIVVNYSALFTPGELLAIAYDEKGSEIARDCRYSFGDTDHIDIQDKQYGRLHFYEMQAVDCDGHPVENAADYVEVKVENGMLLGLDNGDSTDYDSYQINKRRFFRGKLLAIVEETEDSVGEINISATIARDKIPVREVVLERVSASDAGAVVLSPDQSYVELKAYVLPHNADNQDIDFRLTDIYGNDTKLAEMTVTDSNGAKLVRIQGLGDGEFIFRATANDGEDHVRAISQLEIKTDGLGTLYTDPYSFVPGSIYSRSIGGVTNGNERGVATGRDGETLIIFDGVDFGVAGTRTVEIPIFALTDEEYVVQIWDGVKGEAGAELVCDGIYQKHSIWNTYQSETYTLDKKLTGIRTISFFFTNKVHFKGFICEKINPVFEPMWAGNASELYGDQYEVCDQKVEHIGNNVTIGFGTQNFGEGVSKIIIYGRARGGVNTLHVRLHQNSGVVKQVVEVEPTDEYMERTYSITDFAGSGELSVIFMPGSDFDLGWIKFE